MHRALLVACTSFNDPELEPLGDAPPYDVKRLKQVLVKGGFQETKCLVGLASHKLVREIEAFCVGAGQEDLILLYFSTHGLRDKRDLLQPFYLACSNTQKQYLLATAIPATIVNDCMNYSPARSQLLVLDCCYSGAFAQGSAARGQRSAADVGRAFGGEGRIVLTATNKGNLAWQTKSQSIFNRHLVNGLGGEADADRDGWVSVNELYEYVYARVKREIPQQPPQMWAFGAEGPIRLVHIPRGGRPPAPGEPLPPSPSPPDTAPIKVTSRFVRPNGKIQWKYFRGGSYEHYRVRISLLGTDDQLKEIKRVTYKLDPSFREPNRKSSSRASAFAIEIWTYAGFSLKAEIVFRDNTTKTIPYRLKLNLPKDEEEYEDVGD